MNKHRILVAFIIFVSIALFGISYLKLQDYTLAAPSAAAPSTAAPPADEPLAEPLKEGLPDDVHTDDDNHADDDAFPYRDFTAYRQDGTSVTFSDFVGTPIVLNFWTTWCTFCEYEMPHFEKAEKEYPDVLFFMVNMTDGENDTPESVKEFLDEKGFKFNNVLLDTDVEAARVYGVRSYPVTLFIDKDGHIVDGKMGGFTEEELDEKLVAFTK